MPNTVNFIKYCSLLFLTVIASYAKGQEEKQNHSLSLFDSDDIIQLSIKSNFSEIIRGIAENDESYHPGIMYYTMDDGRIKPISVELRTRGNFRKNPDHCSFPPFFIKFDKKQTTNTPFQGLKKTKIVTHCKNNIKAFEQYVVQEYLVYKAYNQLTEASFRVRLAEISYIDAGGSFDTLRRPAFFIENEHQMAERLGGKILKQDRIHQDRTHQDYIDILNVFQYMIANPDWSVSLQHNIKFVRRSPFENPVAVPYDFDFSGVINTRYASPAEVLEIEAVTERTYRGFCRSEEQYKLIFDLFREKKEDIYDLYRENELLDHKRERRSLNFYDKFYKVISKNKKIKKEFLNKCWPERDH